MPAFFLHFSDGRELFPSDLELQFADLHHAYLEVCAAIPETARDLLVKRQDPLEASYTIADREGRVLMVVPLTDVLAPSEWRIAKARRRPHGGPRSTRARDDLALTSFRRMFGSVNAGCVLLPPEMNVVEMTSSVRGTATSIPRPFGAPRSSTSSPTCTASRRTTSAGS